MGRSDMTFRLTLTGHSWKTDGSQPDVAEQKDHVAVVAKIKHGRSELQADACCQ